MTSIRRMLPIVLTLLATAAFAQSDAQNSVATSDMHAHEASATPAPSSEAQKSFDTIKTLAGVWDANSL